MQLPTERQSVRLDASTNEADAPPGNVPSYERCVSAMGWRRGHMLNDDDLTLIGEHQDGYPTLSWRQFGMRRADRRSHLYAIGKTGTGKSTMLERLIRQDLERGEGVALLDPHGDLSERLLDCIPPWRMNEPCYFDPADLTHPVGFNIVADQHPDRRHLARSDAVSAFKAHYGESWSNRIETVLAHTLAALIELPGTTLLTMPRFLTDTPYRERVVQRLADHELKRYWSVEFKNYSRSQQTDWTMSTLTRVEQFLMSPMTRNIFGQETSGFDPRSIMDRRGIFIANLSKGKIGEDSANLIGSLLVSSFALAAAARADIPEHERADFYLYVDEFKNFAPDSFASILSEARKYRLSLALFHQYIDQLSDPLRRAVFGNVGTTVAFRVGQTDAVHLANEFENQFAPERFTGLGRYEVAVRLLAHGAPSTPFTGRTISPGKSAYQLGTEMRAQSRRRHARARADLERELTAQYEAAESDTPKKPSEPKRREPKPDPAALTAWREKMDELEHLIASERESKE